jgi:hypothetical protein
MQNVITIYRHMPRFLFVRGLTTILLVGGLGVENERECPPCDFFVWSWVKEEVCRSEQCLINWNNKFEVLLS